MTNEHAEHVEKRDVNAFRAGIAAWSFVGLLVVIAVFLWFTYSKQLLQWRELSGHGSLADFPEPRLLMTPTPSPGVQR